LLDPSLRRSVAWRRRSRPAAGPVGRRSGGCWPP